MKNSLINNNQAVRYKQNINTKKTIIIPTTN